MSGHVICVKGINLPLSTILLFDCSFFSFFLSLFMSSDTIVFIQLLSMISENTNRFIFLQYNRSRFLTLVIFSAVDVK